MPRYLITSALVAILLAFTDSTYAQTAVETKAPERVALRYGLVVDNSGSFRPLIDKVTNIVSGIIEENGPDDEAFLVTFVDAAKIVLRQDFTFKKPDLHDAAQNMYIEGGQTAILDAVQFSADHLIADSKPNAGVRNALILVTDGDDRDSINKIDSVIKNLKEGNIRIYAIGISDEKVSTKILDRLTKETGGALYLAKNKAEITTAIKDLSAAIRAK